MHEGNIEFKERLKQIKKEQKEIRVELDKEIEEDYKRQKMYKKALLELLLDIGLNKKEALEIMQSIELIGEKIEGDIELAWIVGNKILEDLIRKSIENRKNKNNKSVYDYDEER